MNRSFRLPCNRTSKYYCSMNLFTDIPRTLVMNVIYYSFNFFWDLKTKLKLKFAALAPNQNICVQPGLTGKVSWQINCFIPTFLTKLASVINLHCLNSLFMITHFFFVPVLLVMPKSKIPSINVVISLCMI